MKKILFIYMILFCVSCLLNPVSYAQQENTGAVVDQLCNELEKDSICAPEDLKQIKKPIKNMLDKGASKRDLKITLTDLSKREVKGKDLKRTIDYMNDLVKDGEEPKVAGSVVSQAARQAHIEGLKGKDLAAKVHEAIRQRKEERQQLKMQKWQQKGELKRKAKEGEVESKDVPKQKGYERVKKKGQR